MYQELKCINKEMNTITSLYCKIILRSKHLTKTMLATYNGEFNNKIKK